MLTALRHSNTVLTWTGYVLAALILAGVLTLAGLLAWRGLRSVGRNLDQRASARVAREVAAAGIKPRAEEWQVWDDEAEAGMTDDQVAMLRQGYVPLPAAGEQRLIGAVMQQQAGDAADFEARLLAEPGICSLLSGNPTSCIRCWRNLCEYDDMLSLDPGQGDGQADAINWGPGDRTDIGKRIPWQHDGSGS